MDRGRRVAALLFAVAGLLAVVRLAWPVLAPFVFAVVLAYGLAPLVSRLERRGVPRVLGILLAYALVAIVLGVAVVYVMPQAVQQVMHLARVLPGFIAAAEGAWSHYLRLFHEAPLPLALRRGLNRTTRHLESLLVAQVHGGVQAVFGLVPGLLALLASPVLAFYLLKDRDGIAQRLWHILPYAWHPRVQRMLWDVDAALAGYVRGQLAVAFLVGLMAGVWTAVLGIPFALLVGVVAGVTDIVPYVGPVVGAAPAVLLGLSRSPWTGLWALAGFLALHQIEGSVLAPKVVGDAVGLHPLLVMLAILMGGEWAGIPGMLAAVPVAAMINVACRHFYRWMAMSSRPPGIRSPD